MNLIFGTPGPWAWGLWLAFLVAWTVVFARTARRRLVIYNFDPAGLDSAVADAAEEAGLGRLARSSRGFQADAPERTIRVEGIRRLRVGTVEVRGRDPEILIRRLYPILRGRLLEQASGPTRVTWGFFLLSWATMITPLTLFFATQPKARAAFRAIWMRITGGS